MSCDAVQNTIIWGNHSSTQYPDAAHASVVIGGKKESVKDAVKDDDWLNGDFIKVGKHSQRGCKGAGKAINKISTFAT